MHVEKEEQVYWEKDGVRFIQPETIIDVFESDTDTE